MKPERKKIFDKCGGHCGYCGIKLKNNKFEIEHRQPKSRGGRDNPNNILPACRPCNIRKGPLTVEEFRIQLSADIGRILRIPKVRLLEKYGLIEIVNKKVEFYFEKKEAK